ncbi:MAG TPA: hypothetical protein VFF15_08220 [Flavobacteriaceae bacterium]|nr:hypothetical protein [Flavobacteriaceae bacterium]
MIPVSKDQKRRIAILVKGDKELKQVLVQQVTGDEAKTSTNDLTHAQANQIISKLGGKPFYYDNWALFDKNNKQHLNILSLAMQYGWSIPHPTRGEIADLGRLSEWLKHDKKCPVHNKLINMMPNELSKIIHALEQMIKWKYKK